MAKKIWTIPMMLVTAFGEEDGECHVRIGRQEPKTWLTCKLLEGRKIDTAVRFVFYLTPSGKPLAMPMVKACLDKQKNLIPKLRKGEPQMSEHRLYATTKEELGELVGDFTWNFGQRFFIETARGNYVWSDPRYNGDNVVRPFAGNIKQWLKHEGIDYGRSKGQHYIYRYCAFFDYKPDEPA